MGRLGRLLYRLDRRRLPVHVTPVVKAMVDAIATDAPRPLELLLRALLQPRASDRLLDVLGERGRMFDPLLHNTASVTIVAGGEKINVIPDEVSVEIDCRLLPGFGPQDVFAELRALAGVEMELEVIRFDPGAPEPDMGAVRHARAGAARAGPDGQADPAAASRGHRRALLLAPRAFRPMASCPCSCPRRWPSCS